MNVKLKVLSVGALFFLGQIIEAQERDTLKTTQIEEVVVQQGLRTVTKRTAVTATQKIDNDLIETRGQTNVLNAVQGQLAGVNISTGTGQPGAKPTVIIRGVGSLTGNTDPLYVIDGFPSNADNFRSLNPYDIETFEVLKDAASISEYGNRGSNGVIVITTKRGKMGGSRLSVRYNTQTGLSFLQNNRYRFSDAKQLLTLENRKGSGPGASMTPAMIEANTVDTDWVNYFFRPGFMTSHNINVEKSGKNFASYFSAGYVDQQGILDETYLKRFTFRSNITGKSENGKFNYYVGMALGLSKNSDQPSTGTAGVNQNPILGALSSAPYISPNRYSTSGQLYLDYIADGTLRLSPLFLIDKLKNSYNKFNETRIDATSELSYKLLDGLTVRNRLNAQAQLQRQNFLLEGPNSLNALLFSPTVGVSSLNGGAFNGREQFINNQTFILNELIQADYKKSFGKHSFGLSGAMEYNFSQFEANNQVQRGLNPNTFVPGVGTGYIVDTGTNDFYVPTISTTKVKYNLISYIGSFDYDFDRKYGLVASIRRDGSSRFGTNSTWGTFWSVGGRWNLDQEAFMKDLQFVNLFKIRGSYGTVGNQRVVDGATPFTGILPPGFLDIYTPVNNTYNGGLGLGIAFGDADLRWETTKTYNIGVDFEFFNRRLRGAFDFYNKKTIDMYYEDQIAPIVGTTSINRNTDISLQNQGFELLLAYDLIKKDNFRLTINGNGSLNNQEVSGITRVGGEIASGTTSQTRIRNGELPFLYYQYHYLGVNPSNGNLLFEDANGNATENPVDADRKLAKYNHLPKYQGGFGFDLDYKGFFATTLFTYVAGIMRMDWDLEGAYDPNDIGVFNVSSDLLNAWTPTNTGSNIPSFTAANRGLTTSSDRFLTDASYLRLRNVQIGYRLPKKLLEGTFVNDMTISLQAENLVTWSKWRGFDAESPRVSDQLQYPSARMFTVGFDVKF